MNLLTRREMNRALTPEEMDRNLEKIEASELSLLNALNEKQDIKENLDFILVDHWYDYE